jgi:hypothetical protein
MGAATMSRNRIYMQPIRGMNIHRRVFIFFAFGEGGCEDGFFLILVFLSYSQ